MTAKQIMDVYQGRQFYSTMTNFSMASAHLPKYRNPGEVATAPKKIVHTKDQSLSYPLAQKQLNMRVRDSCTPQPILNCLKQLSKYKGVKERDKKSEDVLKRRRLLARPVQVPPTCYSGHDRRTEELVGWTPDVY